MSEKVKVCFPFLKSYIPFEEIEINIFLLYLKNKISFAERTIYR